MNAEADLATQCFVWRVGPRDDIRKIIAGPPTTSYPAGLVYDPHRPANLCLVFYDTGVHSTMHFNSLEVHYFQELEKKATCGTCNATVTEWFVCSSQVRAGDIACKQCMASNRWMGIYEQGHINAIEDGLPAEMIGADGNVTKEWCVFTQARIEERQLDRLTKTSQSERETTMGGVRRYKQTDVTKSPLTQRKYYLSIEHQVSGKYERDCVVLRIDPGTGQPNTVMEGGKPGARSHLDATNPLLVSHLIYWKEQDATITQQLEFDWPLFFSSWCLIWQAMITTSAVVMKVAFETNLERVDEDEVGSYVMNSDDLDLQVLAAFASSWATTLWTAIKNMKEEVGRGARVACGEVLSFLSNLIAHFRPSGDQTSRLLSFNSVLLREEGLTDEEWLEERARVEAGDFHNNSLTTEYQFMLDLPVQEIMSDQREDGQQLVFELACQLIHCGMRLGEEGNRPMASLNCLCRLGPSLRSGPPQPSLVASGEELGKNERYDLQELAGRDARANPSWEKMLRTISMTTNNGSPAWDKDGDNLAFMSLVLCELIKIHEPRTADEFTGRTFEKYQRGINSAKDKGDGSYLAAARLIGRPGAEKTTRETKEYEDYMKIKEELKAQITAYRASLADEEEKFDYKALTNIVVAAWAKELHAKNEAPNTIRTIILILGLMCFEVPVKIAKMASSLSGKQGKLEDVDRDFLYCFCHGCLCIFEYGMATVASSANYPGAFDFEEVYRTATMFLQVLTTKYEYPSNASLYKLISREMEIVAEVAAVVVLLEKPGILTPPGMKITPLHVYRIMNDYLMTEDGTFRAYFRPKKKKTYFSIGDVARQKGYVEAHHYITFCFLRAVLERSWLASFAQMPRRVMRNHSWLSRESNLDLPSDVIRTIEGYAGDPELTDRTTSILSVPIDLT